jgi:hypothetical protein
MELVRKKGMEVSEVEALEQVMEIDWVQAITQEWVQVLE